MLVTRTNNFLLSRAFGLTMNGSPYSIPEGGRCNACGLVFVREGNLIQHICGNCTAAQLRSQDHWKHGTTNLLKLGRVRNPRKRPSEETPDSHTESEQANFPHQWDIVCVLVCASIPFLCVV